MIQSLRVTNPLGESLTLELSNPESSGLIVRSVSGLGPPTATINTYELATIDGSRYIGAKAQTRNITLSLSPMWLTDSSMEENRRKAYEFFPIKGKIIFEVVTDQRQAYCTGYVEQNEPDIFSQDEKMDISIICPDPYFYQSGDGEEIVFTGIEPELEFEFGNESLSENLLELSQIKTLKSATIEYTGDAEIGFTMSLRFVGAVTGDILIYNPVTRETMSIDTSLLPQTIQNNDILEISTVPGKKYIKFIRGSTITNSLNAVDRTTLSWLALRQGSNTIIYTADSGEDNILFTMTFKPAFQGV